jgi:hypothetical protein
VKRLDGQRACQESALGEVGDQAGGVVTAIGHSSEHLGEVDGADRRASRDGVGHDGRSGLVAEVGQQRLCIEDPRRHLPLSIASRFGAALRQQFVDHRELSGCKILQQPARLLGHGAVGQ